MRTRDDRGVSLVELGFVLLLMLLITANQVSTWADTIRRNQDVVAERELSVVAQTMRYTFLGQVPEPADAVDQLAAAEPTYTYNLYNAESHGPKDVSVLTVPAAGGADVVLTVRSNSGTCMTVRDHWLEGPSYAKWEREDSLPCSAETAVTHNEWLTGGLRAGTPIPVPTPIAWSP